VTSPVLELEQVTLQAGPIQLLRDISLRVDRGQTIGLVGESGAGKSMIGRLISGLVPPRFQLVQGRLLFDGADLTQQSAHERRALLGRRIAFVPQEPLSALNPVLTIGQQFAEHLARLHVPQRQRRTRAVAWLDAVHLPEPAATLRRYPHELSGGQCQRVLIAMAFSSEPALIVADEPTTALDVITQARIMQLLKEQQKLHGAAVVLITHDLHLAAQACDDVGVMYAGDMVEYGPASDVLRFSRHPYTNSLRHSVPTLVGERRILPALPDQMPGLGALAGLSGCRFAPRCPAHDGACTASLPVWRNVAPNHRVRCAHSCEGAEFPPPADIPKAKPRGETSAPPVLELRDVCLRYVGRRGLFSRRAKTVDAVRHVSLQVRRGEFLGLVGESGSGKSSIARLVMGLEQPTGGNIVLDGRDAAGSAVKALREHAQIVFQDPQSALNPRRSVFRLVTQSLEVPEHHVTPAERAQQASRLLKETGLPPDCLHRVPAQLSGGQRQRVNIARALCVTPHLLVADEIVSGLDVSVQAQILNLLLQLGRELGISLLFISHDLAVVRYLCTRVAVMHRGEIVETGDTEAVFANPQHDYTRRLLEAVPSAA
jgi:peptide/nickel transport system ATP-binding protein